MLSMQRIRSARLRHSHHTVLSLATSPSARHVSSSRSRCLQHRSGCANSRLFTTSRCYRQDEPSTKKEASAEEIERVVRQAAQRFRDTLPKGYLNDQEYALYERLYGPPLRETQPEDVGIPTHADMGLATPRPDDEGTLPPPLEGGESEKVTCQLSREATQGEGEKQMTDASAGIAVDKVSGKAPGYIEAVARSKREYDALLKLAKDFETTQREQKEMEKMAIVEEEEEEPDEEDLDDIERERQRSQEEEEEDDEHGTTAQRFHRYTLEGKFRGNPVELILPPDELEKPIRDLLARTHISHVKKAAEEAYGGEGLPSSPATPLYFRKRHAMTGVGLPPDQRHMTEIEADAFIAAYMPPAYASVMCILREVRKRVGSEWLQSRLKQGKRGELRVLDAGAGGAGLVSWEQIVKAEWEVLKEKGEVSGAPPAGKKSAVVASDRLRARVKTFLPDTTFLPKLPDYEHSGEMQGEHLDAGHNPQGRKSFDIVIASHLLLKEEQGHRRQAVLNNLWNVLNKDGGILIIIEKAHPRGFEAVAHARDTILRQFLLPQSGEPSIDPKNLDPALDRVLEPGHVIAPCTNQGACPLYKEPGESLGRKDYCHFDQRFVRPNFYCSMFGTKRRTMNRGAVEFSYVAIRRGVPSGRSLSGKEATIRAFRGYEDAEKPPDIMSLPRMMLRPLKRKGHITMDMCTPEGQYERWTLPKSFSKQGFRDARKSEWGDLWALGAKSRQARKVRLGGPKSGGYKKKPARHRTREAAAKEKKLARRNMLEEGGKKRDVEEELLEAEEWADAMIERDIDEEAQERPRASEGKWKAMMKPKTNYGAEAAPWARQEKGRATMKSKTDYGAEAAPRARERGRGRKTR